jgi:O-antigen ligase
MPVVADNAYLSALVETGIAGLGAMLAASAAMLTLAWRAMRVPALAAQLFGAWMLCFWAGQMAQMISGDLLTYWRVLPVYFWALGMAVRYSTPSRRDE